MSFPIPEQKPFGLQLMLIGIYIKGIKAKPDCIVVQKISIGNTNLTIRRIHCDNGSIIETTIKDN